MIVTASSQPHGAKATVIGQKSRYSYFGYPYEGFKYAARTYGFYQDIKPYLPETYLDKYRYKPHKRVSGYLGLSKGFLKKKRRIITKRYQFDKERCGYNSKHWNYSTKCAHR